MTAAVAASTLALGLLLATPAVAADETGELLELSEDGVHFTSGQVRVFKDTGGYVPGETRPGTVWIRNASSEDTRFSLAVVNTSPGLVSELPRYLELRAGTATQGEGVTVLPGPGLCAPVGEERTLPAGGALQLDLNLTLLRQAPNSTRDQQSSFDLIFLLQGGEAGSGVQLCADSSVLAGTDASMGRAPLMTGPASVVLAEGDATALAAAEPPQQAGPGSHEPWTGLPQSNVVAIIRSPWPWLFALSAGAYMAMSFWRRRRTQ